jgi:Na+/proline symporter
MSAASMTATWIWAASFYAAASSGYKYGISGALHYGLWGALMILFIYPFGKRFRQLAPKAHTLAEIMHARHGRSSQMILAGSNILGSGISLMVNFTAAGALVDVLSPLTFTHGVLIAGVGVLSYTLWSGFRSSVLTDFGQLLAMIIAAVVIIPMMFFQLGGPELFTEGMARLTPEQSTFFSKSAILEQGAPFFVAVLAYAIGNQTIAQRLFAVREDLIKPTFITATIGYGAIVIGLGMLGFLALMAGVQPLNGDLNNLIPQMAATYLPPFVIGVLFIMIIGALSSTADSDLSALTTVGVIFASLKLDILTMLIFVGALWGTIVFPVIASLFWERVTNQAFTSAVAAGFAMFLVTRFELLPLQGAVAVFFELCASVGGGVVIGMMAFGFFGRTAGLVFGFLALAVFAPFAVGFLRDYAVLLSSLTAYGVSTMVCVAVSLSSKNSFDFDSIGERVVAFQTKAR